MMRKTIWDDDATAEDDIRPLLRVGLPLQNVLFMFSGFVGWFVPLPSVARLTTDPGWEWVAPLYGLALGLSAAVALFGLAFRFRRIEVGAKLVMLGLLGAFVVAVWLRTWHEPAIVASSSTAIIYMILPAWRLWLLGTRKRREGD
jgi:hypothetical protein